MKPAMKMVNHKFFSYVHVLYNLHKHLCTGYMLLEKVQGKLCSELFLISHSLTSETLFKHLVPEDCRPLFCVRQIVKIRCQPQKQPTPWYVCGAQTAHYQVPVPKLTSEESVQV